MMGLSFHALDPHVRGASTVLPSTFRNNRHIAWDLSRDRLRTDPSTVESRGRLARELEGRGEIDVNKRGKARGKEGDPFLSHFEPTKQKTARAFQYILFTMSLLMAAFFLPTR